jgi:hypothetical protein
MASRCRCHTTLLSRRRYFVFDAKSLSLKYYDSEAAAASGKAKGEFALNPLKLDAALTEEHSKPFELRITSNDQSLYATAESAAEATALLQHIDVARRAVIAGDDGSNLITVDDALAALKAAAPPGEPGVKAFTWGVGPMLGVGNQAFQGMAVPQRVNALRPP